MDNINRALFFDSFSSSHSPSPSLNLLPPILVYSFLALTSEHLKRTLKQRTTFIGRSWRRCAGQRSFVRLRVELDKGGVDAEVKSSLQGVSAVVLSVRDVLRLSKMVAEGWWSWTIKN